MSVSNDDICQSAAEREGLVDAHLLNGMLRVYANSGRIEPALRFYDTEYKKHGVVSMRMDSAFFVFCCFFPIDAFSSSNPCYFIQ